MNRKPNPSKGEPPSSLKWAAYLASLWLFLFLLLPNLVLFINSFLRRLPDGNVGLPLNLDSYRAVLSRGSFYALLQSLVPAWIAAMISLLIGYPLVVSAQLLLFEKKADSKLFFFLLFPFTTQSLIRLYGLRLLLGKIGPLNRFLLGCHFSHRPFQFLYTRGAVILGLVYLLLPFMLLPLWLGVRKIRVSYLEAARDLGATPWQTFLRITLPLSLPSALSGFTMVFVPAAGMFYVADFLGGGKHLLLGNLIKGQLLILRDTPLASATSSLLAGSVLLLGSLPTIFSKCSEYSRRGPTPIATPETAPWLVGKKNAE